MHLYGVIPFAGAVQVPRWQVVLKKENIKQFRRFQGLKMRIPGLGGDVFKEVGGLPVTHSPAVS